MEGDAALHVTYDNGTDGTMPLAEAKILCDFAAEE